MEDITHWFTGEAPQEYCQFGHVFKESTVYTLKCIYCGAEKVAT